MLAIRKTGQVLTLPKNVNIKLKIAWKADVDIRVEKYRNIYYDKALALFQQKSSTVHYWIKRKFEGSIKFVHTRFSAYYEHM